MEADGIAESTLIWGDWNHSSPRASAWSKRAVRGPLAFLFDPRMSFSFGQRVCLSSPFGCEPEPLGLGKVAGRAPKPLHGARGPSGAPLAFYTPLAHEGLFAEAPLGASLGRGASARLQEGLPRLRTEQEGR